MLRSFALTAFNFAKMTNRMALNSALDEELARDPNVFLMGEEVGQYHGAYKISKGLLDKYGPNRIVDTPITEAGFTGIGVGASAMGLRPVIEFMTINFALQAIDHIINSAAKLHYMSNGRLSCPIVFRGLNGPAAAVAAQHSQCFAAWYANIPGLITLSPYDAEDNKGLLKTAIRSGHTVMFLENENLYGETFEVSEEALGSDFLIPIGQAKVMRQGKHVTIVAYSRNVKYSLEAADILAREGISCEVVNLRSIRPLDRTTIVKSVMKTGRLVTVEDGFPMCGVGAEIVATINETDAFNYLDAPIERVTAVDAPMPYAQILEEAMVPRADSIVKAVKKTLRGVRL